MFCVLRTSSRNATGHVDLDRCMTHCLQMNDAWTWMNIRMYIYVQAPLYRGTYTCVSRAHVSICKYTLVKGK